jgi:hypothetical protein
MVIAGDVSTPRVADAFRYRQALLRDHVQRAARLSWQRKVSTSPTVQALTTSFVRFAPRASGSSLTVLDPIASKIGCARSSASPRPDASTTSRPCLAVFLVRHQ